ncbi:FAD-dependent monooxygenase [Saccharopolyspora sp. 5N708]|uniref:FAD-dependent monooxygenase n=1 Tax=Saccharopolyspora sp. 5N708 TaxID=3457424 RepID=UPI003FD490A0
MVERAADRRSGGYTVLVHGTGVYAAERLGIADAIPTRNFDVRTTYEVLRSGFRMPGYGLGDIPTRPRIMMRGRIEKALFNVLPTQTEVRYSTTPVAIEQDDTCATVTLRNNVTDVESTGRFELVVGADGVRSTVRSLVFGPHENYTKPTGYMTAAALMREHISGFEPHEGFAYTARGKCAWAFPLVDLAAPP